MLKCKFGGSFETRPCWSCPASGDPLPPPHQVPAMELAADSVSCVPPRLDGFPGRPRAYAGPSRLELTANDQQWTQRALTYEYLSPWDVLSLYPSSGPSLGGTFIQVRGMGLYAAATGEVHPVAWYGAFITHDVDANAQLEPQELEGAIAHVRAAGALPEATLVDEAAVAGSVLPYPTRGEAGRRERKRRVGRRVERHTHAARGLVTRLPLWACDALWHSRMDRRRARAHRSSRPTWRMAGMLHALCHRDGCGRNGYLALHHRGPRRAHRA